MPPYQSIVNAKQELDRGTPACNRCLKAGHKCAGYNVPLRVQAHIVSDTGKLVKVSGGVSTIDLPQPPERLSLVGFQEHIAFSFFFGSYRWAHYWRPLLQIIPGDETDFNYKASLAVAMGYMARIKKSPELEEQAIQLNLYAVTELRLAVIRGVKADLARMLLTLVGALGIYNFSVNHNFRYVHHYGAQMILKFCGPASFDHEPNLTGFRHCRKMLYCLSLAFKCKTFLAMEPWKKIPSQFHMRTTEDKLFEILVDIPGLAETVTTSYLAEGGMIDVAEKLKILQTKLCAWRIEWEVLNSRAVVESAGVSSKGLNRLPLAEAILSTVFVFQTAQQAVELLYYNTAMLYLSHLQFVLDGECPAYQTVSSVTNHQAYYTHKLWAQQRSTPLLLPHEITFHWEHGIEGLRILDNLRGELSRCGEIYLVTAPIAILYCFSKYLGIQQSLLSMVSDEPWTEQEEAALARYEVTAGAFSLVPVSDDEQLAGDQESQSSTETPDFGELFVKISRS